MRCQKARSCLSAYCNGELGERQSLDIRSHLASCPSCREVERSWNSLREATREIPTRKVTADFNARLLNRIAEERFTETRQSVPQPSSLGWLRFRQWIPALAGSAAVALLVATGVLQRGATLLPALVNNEGKTTVSTDIALDDSYLTAQPGISQQRRLGTHLHESQSIHQSMALSDRVSTLSRGLSPQYGFGAQFANSGSGFGSNPYQPYGRRIQIVPGSIVIRREIGFSGERMRIYLVPSADTQTSHGEEAARY